MGDLVVVAGATGYLGRHVVRALHAAGHRVRALARDADRLNDVCDLCHEVFVGRAAEADSLAGLCEGADAVFSSLGKRDFKRRPSLEEVDYQANRNILDRAVEARVGRFLFISAKSADAFREMGLSMPREDLVDDLVASGLPWTVLRPTGFFNDMEEMFQMAVKGTGWVLGDGSVTINPIHGADLAAEVVRRLEDPSAAGAAYDVGGPDVFTMREIVSLAFEVLGKEPKIKSCPLWVIRVIASVARPFHSMLGSMLGAVGRMDRVDMVGAAVGTHHLRDFFEELAGSLPPA